METFAERINSNLRKLKETFKLYDRALTNTISDRDTYKAALQTIANDARWKPDWIQQLLKEHGITPKQTPY